MKKIIKLFTVCTIAVSMLVPVIPVQDEFVQIVEASEPANEDVNIVETIEDMNCVSVEGDEIVYDEEAIYEGIENIDIEALNKVYKENNFEPISKEELAKMFISGLEYVNDEIENDQLTVLSDGSMIESDDDSFYLQGGSTYDKTYWWGKRRYKSTSAANTWVRKLNKCAAVEGGAGVVSSAFGFVPAVAGGLCCAYAWYLASDVAYYNGLSNRGIRADIPWCLVGYKVRKQ